MRLLRLSRYATLLLLVAVAFSAIPGPAVATPTAGPRLVASFPVGPSGAKVEELIGDGLRGPESFSVDEARGEILILDSSNSRVVTLKPGQSPRMMPIQVQGRPIDIKAADGGSLYILDDSPTMYRIGGTGKVAQSVPVAGLSAGNIAGFGDSLEALPVLRTRTNQEWHPTEGARNQSVSGQEISVTVEPGMGRLVDSSSNTLVSLPFSGAHGAVSLIGTDDQKNIFVAVEDVLDEDLGTFWVDLRIKRYSSSGSEIGDLRIPLQNYAVMPQKYALVSRSGLLYVMVVASDQVVIYRTDLVGDQTIPLRPTQLEPAANPIEMSTVSSVLPLAISVPDRTTVRNRADAMMNLQWVYRTSNGDWNRPYVTAPEQYSPPPLNGTTQTGIPYCWGGFDGLDKSSEPTKWANYTQAMAYGAEAGNINTSSSQHQVDTAGVDCSGFVSAALNLPYHYGPNLYGASNLISGASLQAMDILIRVGSHVLFFVSEDSSGNVMTKESTVAGSPDAAKDYTRTWSSLAVQGYEPRSFWTGTANAGTSFDTAIVLGDPYSYRVGGYVTQGTSKYYMTPVMRGETCTISLTPDGAGNPNLVVYDNNRVFVGSSSNAVGVDSVTFIAASTSFYYIRVDGATTARYYLSQQ